VLVGLAVAPAGALADKRDEAKAHVAKATKLHKDGHYEEARVELEAAYALDPKPDLLYAIGQVYAKLGKCSEATTYYKHFAAMQKDPEVAKVVDQAIAACKPASEPRAAPATSSDNPPAPPATTTTDKPPATEAKPTTSDKPGSATSRPQPFASTPQVQASGAEHQREPWYKDKLGDGLVLGGIVVTIVGLVEYGSARSDLDQAEDQTATTNLARYQELVDSAHGKRAAAVVLIGAGGALITGGIVHYVIHERTMETRGISVAPAHGGGVVTYEGRF
jgi:tetratricopeptide (TPR) repeat protein